MPVDPAARRKAILIFRDAVVVLASDLDRALELHEQADQFANAFARAIERQDCRFGAEAELHALVNVIALIND